MPEDRIEPPFLNEDGVPIPVVRISQASFDATARAAADEPLFDSICVPLCGAAKAYGRFVKPWHHSPFCPARDERRIPEETSGELFDVP